MATRATQRTGTVLVVEDEKDVREVARGMLGRLGHSVLCAEDGQAALKTLESGHVDAIMLDMMMPRMYGEAFLGLLAKTHPELVSRVIVVTGHPPEGGEEYAVRLGVHDYLRKPYKVSQLAWKVQQVLELAALQERWGAEVSGTEETLHERLTPRQLQVLVRVAEGKPLKWIAGELRISVRTARVKGGPNESDVQAPSKGRCERCAPRVPLRAVAVSASWLLPGVRGKADLRVRWDDLMHAGKPDWKLLRVRPVALDGVPPVR